MKEKRYWGVAFCGWSGSYWARWPAGAVAAFRRQFGAKLAKSQRAIRVDGSTGGWNGLSVGLVSRIMLYTFPDS